MNNKLWIAEIQKRVNFIFDEEITASAQSQESFSL